MKILILNGPNLNLLGKREPGIYGSKGFEEYFEELKKRYPEVKLAYCQSNTEGAASAGASALGVRGRLQWRRIRPITICVREMPSASARASTFSITSGGSRIVVMTGTVRFFRFVAIGLPCLHV